MTTGDVAILNSAYCRKHCFECSDQNWNSGTERDDVPTLKFSNRTKPIMKFRIILLTIGFLSVWTMPHCFGQSVFVVSVKGGRSFSRVEVNDKYLGTIDIELQPLATADDSSCDLDSAGGIDTSSHPKPKRLNESLSLDQRLKNAMTIC